MISASDNIAANIVHLVRPEAVSAMAARLGLTKTRGTRKCMPWSLHFLLTYLRHVS